MRAGRRQRGLRSERAGECASVIRGEASWPCQSGSGRREDPGADPGKRC